MNVPAHLSAEEAAVFREVAALLGPLAEPLDWQVLEAYAVERCRWLVCEAFLKEHGDVVVLRTDKGEVRAVQEAPQLKIAQRSREAALKLAAQMGLIEA